MAELMADPALINLVARIVQDHFGTPLGDPERPHLVLSKREAVALEILDGLAMMGCVRFAPTRAGTAPAGLQLDLLTALVRIQQLHEQLTETEGSNAADNLLWDRIVTCDGSRLYRYLEPATLKWLEQAMNEDIQEMLARYVTEWTPGRWYRVLQPDGSIWMETSDPEEAHAEAAAKGWPLLRQWRWERTEWRTEDAPAPAEEEEEMEDPCCEDSDELSSHYHCANCGQRCSMMGHIDTAGNFTCQPAPAEESKAVTE